MGQPVLERWGRVKSYLAEPTCKTIIIGDIDGDCSVDFADFELMGFHRLQEHRTMDDE